MGTIILQIDSVQNPSLDQLCFCESSMSSDQVKEQASQAVSQATDAFDKLKADGFLKHFGEYNVELLRPLKQAQTLSMEGLKKAVIGYFTGSSSSKLEAQVS